MERSNDDLTELPHDWVDLESSVIRSVKYRQSEEELLIRFNHGALYIYYEVPATEFAGLLAAESHGQYFNAFIRSGYNYQEVRG
ncbi:MAG: KTSC domain-containing protein [Thermomicrobiales bacterium]|nr:KTSC domain-containing protein [Thermomicrobiales bacterium]